MLARNVTLGADSAIIIDIELQKQHKVEQGPLVLSSYTVQKTCMKIHIYYIATCSVTPTNA